MNDRLFQINKLLIILLFLIASLAAQEALDEHLQPLKPYIGKTWKGVYGGSEEGKKNIDISKWERALNGKAVRIQHSINDGEYGGETIIMWNAEKESLVFFYFTTAGFYTQGTFSIEDGQFTSHEFVTGNENGITEVKATGKILPDGRLHSKAEYYKKGEWVDGHEFYYTEAPGEEVIFK
jgi:hypothetical protein